MSNDIVYLKSGLYPEGVFIHKREAVISPDDRGFVFGDGVYEVVRAYEGRWFRMPDHLQRLANSLREARIGLEDVSFIPCMADQLLEKNADLQGDALLYLQVTRGTAPRAHPFPNPPVPPTVYMALMPAPDTRRHWNEGVSLVTVDDFRWSRCDIKTVSLQANVLAMQSVRDAGADECLFVRSGLVTECAHSNFFVVLHGVLRTHPADSHILRGITRQCVLELCASLDIPVQEEAVVECELPEAEEAFLSATSWEIAPVIRINGRAVGNGKPGPITRSLQEAFRRLTTPY